MLTENMKHFSFVFTIIGLVIMESMIYSRFNKIAVTGQNYLFIRNVVIRGYQSNDNKILSRKCGPEFQNVLLKAEPLYCTTCSL